MSSNKKNFQDDFEKEFEKEKHLKKSIPEFLTQDGRKYQDTFDRPEAKKMI
jgi:hypothetical protein